MTYVSYLQILGYVEMGMLSLCVGPATKAQTVESLRG